MVPTPTTAQQPHDDCGHRLEVVAKVEVVAEGDAIGEHGDECGVFLRSRVVLEAHDVAVQGRQRGEIRWIDEVDAAHRIDEFRAPHDPDRGSCGSQAIHELRIGPKVRFVRGVLWRRAG